MTTVVMTPRIPIRIGFSNNVVMCAWFGVRITSPKQVHPSDHQDSAQGIKQWPQADLRILGIRQRRHGLLSGQMLCSPLPPLSFTFDLRLPSGEFGTSQDKCHETRGTKQIYPIPWRLSNRPAWAG